MYGIFTPGNFWNVGKYSIYIYILVGGIPTPLKNMSSSVGMIKTIVKLDICSPTERYRTGASHCTKLGNFLWLAVNSRDSAAVNSEATLQNKQKGNGVPWFSRLKLSRKGGFSIVILK